MKIQVECYSGYRGEETPRKVILGSNHVTVKEIIDRWLAPDHRYFKFRGDDESTYIIRHSVEQSEWELTLYRKKGSKAVDGAG